jgi:pimeloyl-ACP methyl ester carboxylesterase
MPASKTARRRPPAPAGLSDEREAACIRDENSRVEASFVTTEARVTSEFSHEFVRRSTIRSMARPRILLIHGSVVNGASTWAAQRPLGDRFELVVPNRRGFPPGPEIARVDYEEEAVWLEFLEPGTHLVGHSYGGVIALLAAARRPELLRSLTVVEPPAMRVARGIRPRTRRRTTSSGTGSTGRRIRRSSCAASSRGSARRRLLGVSRRSCSRERGC